MKKSWQRKDDLRKTSTGELIFCIVVGLILGTVFAVLPWYAAGPIPKSEAIQADAVLSSYTKNYRRYGFRHSRLKNILLRFEDHDPVFVESVCLDDEIEAKIDTLTPGTVLRLYIHPHSSTVWEIDRGDEVLLSFEESTEAFIRNNKISTVMGIVMYLLATVSAFGLIYKKRLRSKPKSKRKRASS